MLTANEKCGGSWCSFKSRRCSPFSRSPITADTNRYVTNIAFTSYPPTQFTYPNGRQANWAYDSLYRRQSCVDPAVPTVTIASWQYYGPGRAAEVSLNNQAVIQTMLNNARTNSAVQSGVPNPAWGTQGSDRLGYDGAGRMITKRYLTGGINGSTYAYNNTSALVGQTTAYDHGGNKFYERSPGTLAEPKHGTLGPLQHIQPLPGWANVPVWSAQG
jgi:hypothetical protein